MKEYVLLLNKHDQDLIDITCLHPAPVEAFAFIPVEAGKIKVSTVDRKRYERWVKALEVANKGFKIIDA
ncbi:hypothetical protein [Pseudomonas tremae]|uniref:hypothetical protein n=1 Tax=Pseudomonas tremae TaxID=200454 RepID=UPI000465C7E6|nr:hypothetical protein [Pseudomonas tremae]